MVRTRDAVWACGLFMLFASGAAAADKTVRVGVINDQSSIYADMGGPGSVVAAQLAIELFLPWFLAIASARPSCQGRAREMGL